MPKRGIDVSQHQGSIDWSRVADDGYRFAICKTSEGQDFRDPSWTRGRVKEIRRAGLELGVYHFLRPRPGRSGAVEAKWAVKTAESAGWRTGRDMRMAADIEATAFTGPLASLRTRRYLRQFVMEVYRLTGEKPFIYTFPAFWKQIGGFRSYGCKLWIAHYGVSAPTVPLGWKTVSYTIWQHSSAGRVDGIAGRVDLNIDRRG